MKKLIFLLFALMPCFGTTLYSDEFAMLIDEGKFYNTSMKFRTLSDRTVHIDAIVFISNTGAERPSFPINEVIRVPPEVSRNGKIYRVTSVDLSSCNFRVDGYHNIKVNECIEKIILPMGIARIISLEDYSSLSEINFPASLREIGPSAFSGCTSLEKIHITGPIEEIGSSAFSGCESLSEVHFSDFVEEIGSSAFSGCTSLEKIHITGPIEEIGSSAFSGCTSLSEINFPASLRMIGSFAFSDCTSLEKIHFAGSVEVIGYGAFTDCTSLSEIHFPDSLQEISSYAFEGCNISELYIPKSVTSIGFVPFPPRALRKVTVDDDNPVYDSRNGCNAIIHTAANSLINGCVNTVIPESVTSIGYRAFRGSIKLDYGTPMNEVNIPESVDSIADNAFAGCMFTEVVLPESLKYIGSMAFDCPGLRSILCKNPNPQSCEEYSFSSETYNNGILYVPCGSSDIYRNKTPWYRFKNIVEFDRLFTFKADDPAHGSVEVLEEINCDRVDYTLKVTPAEGYEFVQWSDGNTDNPRKVELTGDNDTSFVAQFNELYLLSLLSNCTENDSLIGDGYYRYGNTVSIEAIPDSGYLFVQWSDGNTDNPRQVTVTRDTAFTAEFVKLYTLSITYSPLDDYSVGGYASGNGTYRYGTDVTIRATPFNGYLFDRWSDGNTDNPRHVTLTQDTVFTPVFIRERCSLLLSGDHASSLDGEGEYDCGSTVTIRAYPEDGFRFDKWVRDVTEEEEVEFTTTENPYTFTLTSDMSFTAMFLPDGTATDDISLSGFSAVGAAGGIEIHRAAAPVEVYDIMGRKVYAGTDSWIALSQSGVYIVRHKEQTVKVVVR